MMRTYMCFVILVIFVQLSKSKVCFIRTESGGGHKTCCAGYEEYGKMCIPCSKGYISHTGQKCRPCLENNYGEKCLRQCFCSGDDICNHVEGCLEPSSSTNTLEHDMSDTTTLPGNLEATSNGESIAESVNAPMGRDIIVYLVLSAFVIIFGVGFCIVLFKNKALAKQGKAIIIPSQNPAISEDGQNFETENCLYEIIDETDMLDDQQIQQKEMSSTYLDVIDDSNIKESDQMKRFEKYENLCQLMSAAQTHTQEHQVDCRSLMRGDNTFSDESIIDSTQDFLNPYQCMIQSEMSPPEVSEYLTLAPDNSDDSSSSTDEFVQILTQDYLNPYQSMIQSEISPPEVTKYLTLASANSKIDSCMSYHKKSQRKNSLQHLRNVEENDMTNTYENVLEEAYPSDRPI